MKYLTYVVIAGLMFLVVACSTSTESVAPTDEVSLVKEVAEIVNTATPLPPTATPTPIPPTATTVPTSIPTVMPTSTSTLSSMSIPGYNTLYIGHSFGKPFADRLTDFAENSEIDGHSQDVTGRGGSEGSPQALWNNEETKLEIQGILDSGDIDLLIMICCSKDLIETRSDSGITNWIDYALSKNSNTKFALALPWLTSPQGKYANAAEYANRWHGLHEKIWHPLIDELKKRYPETEIFCIPHGRAAIELRSQFEAGTLDDVDAMISNDGNAIFRDSLGHADRILLETPIAVCISVIRKL